MAPGSLRGDIPPAGQAPEERCRGRPGPLAAEGGRAGQALVPGPGGGSEGRGAPPPSGRPCLT